MTYDISVQNLNQVREMDQRDPLRKFRDEFHIPQHGGSDAIYLCGNSLGLQPKRARSYVDQELDDWAKLGVEGHFHAKNPWMPYHEFLTDKMAEIVGAHPAEVVVMNSLTVNLHLLMVSFYRPLPGRRKILVESDLFPSDLYAVTSQISFHGGNPDTDILYWKPREGEYTLRYEDLEELIDAHKHEIALIMVGGVNYYTGQAFDLKRIVSLGHEHNITVGFDLAHWAGNIAENLHVSGADFAAWCSYKYLNSGPGSLSGVFIHERHHRDSNLPRFAGWWGHNKQTRFGMRDAYDPIHTAEGWQLSNPPILPMAAMRASLEIFHEAGMTSLRSKSVELTSYCQRLIKEANIDNVTIITPEDPDDRGCQLSLMLTSNGRKVFEHLSGKGVIADWRQPDVIRIAPVPLYNNAADVYGFVKLLEEACSQF